jgi:hypothetical protein
MYSLRYQLLLAPRKRRHAPLSKESVVYGHGAFKIASEFVEFVEVRLKAGARV